MGSKDRLKDGALSDSHDLGPVDSEFLELGHRVGKTVVAGRAGGVQILDAVNLFGSVGQVEVDRERPHQLDGLDHVDAVEKLSEGRAGLLVAPKAPGHGPNLLDALEQAGPVLAHQGIAQLGAQPSDVVAKCGIYLVEMVGRCHGIQTFIAQLMAGALAKTAAIARTEVALQKSHIILSGFVLIYNGATFSFISKLLSG